MALALLRGLQRRKKQSLWGEKSGRTGVQLCHLWAPDLNWAGDKNGTGLSAVEVQSPQKVAPSLRWKGGSTPAEGFRKAALCLGRA